MTIPLTPCVHGRNFCIWCHANQTDQALPLSATERAELEQLRHNARLHQNAEQLMLNKRYEALLDVAAMAPRVYVLPADAKIHGDRKLTQALLEAGRIHRETADLGVVFDEAPAPRRSLPKLAGYLAFVTACGLGAVLALLVLGMIVKVLP